jgi:plasmid stability protein
MGQTIEIQGLGEEVIAKLKVRAIREGVSLSSYVAKILTQAVEGPSPEELRARMEVLSDMGGGATREQILAAIRQSRDN